MGKQTEEETGGKALSHRTRGRARYLSELGRHLIDRELAISPPKLHPCPRLEVSCEYAAMLQTPCRYLSRPPPLSRLLAIRRRFFISPLIDVYLGTSVLVLVISQGCAAQISRRRVANGSQTVGWGVHVDERVEADGDQRYKVHRALGLRSQCAEARHTVCVLCFYLVKVWTRPSNESKQSLFFSSVSASHGSPIGIATPIPNSNRPGRFIRE
jgi:hypothetical protein